MKLEEEMMSVAIVTGASSGIGAEFARLIKERGVDEIWLVARRADRLTELGEELGISYRVITADLTDSEGIGKVKAELESRAPSVKYLVNAAGFGDFGAYDEISEDAVSRMIDLNVKALVLITHATLPYMERGGHIIELGSGSCFTPLPYFNVYAASKSFVLHYSKALKHEIKEHGVSVTCFCPGWVHTEFLGKATADSTVTRPKESFFKPLLECKKVVAGCMRAADKGKLLYVTNWYTKMQHLLFKILPDCILTGIWLKNIEYGEKRRKGNGKKGQ